MALAEHVRKLGALQDLDTRIRQWEEEKAHDPDALVELRRQVSTAEAALADETRRSEEAELTRRAKDKELQADAERMNKYKEQLLSVKTNKEYHALLHEIEGAKADSSLLEDEILALMVELDALAADVEKVSAELKIKQAELKKAEKAHAAHMAALEVEMSGVLAERETLRADIDPDVLKRYDRILVARAGIAVAKVGPDRVCSGCNSLITHQTLNELMRGQRIIVCENCGRMLFLNDSEGE